MRNIKLYYIIFSVIVFFNSAQVIHAEVLDIPGYTYQGSIQTTGVIESSTTVMSPNGDIYSVFAIDGKLQVFSKAVGADGFTPYTLSFASGSPVGVRSVQAFNRFADIWMVFYIGAMPQGGEAVYSLSFDAESGVLKNDDIRYDEDKGDSSLIERFEVKNIDFREFYVFSIKPEYVSVAYISGYDGKSISRRRSVSKNITADTFIIRPDFKDFIIVAFSKVDVQASQLTITTIPIDGLASSVEFSVPTGSQVQRLQMIGPYEGTNAFALLLSGYTIISRYINSSWHTLCMPLSAKTVVANGYPLESFALVSDDGIVVSIPADISSYSVTSVTLNCDEKDSLFLTHENGASYFKTIVHGFSSSSGYVIEQLLCYDSVIRTWTIVPSDYDYSAYTSVKSFRIKRDDVALLLTRPNGEFDYIKPLEAFGVIKTTAIASEYKDSAGYIISSDGVSNLLWPDSNVSTGWRVIDVLKKNPINDDVSVVLDLTLVEKFIKNSLTIENVIVNSAIYVKAR